MKTLVLFIALFSTTFFASSQCDIFPVISQQPGTCAESSLMFFGYASINCVNWTNIDYTWTANDASGVIVIATQSGNAIAPTQIPIFTVDQSITAGLISVCLSVTANDMNGDPINTQELCYTSIAFPTPLAVTLQTSSNQCGSVCLSNVAVSNGSAPYTYALSNGEVVTPNFWTCFEETGVYILTVVDANGCTGSANINVSPNTVVNNSCENAMMLNSGETLIDTLCTLSTVNVSCSGIQYYQYGWYMINSGTSSHMNIGLSSFYSSGVNNNFPSSIEVYEVPTGENCANAAVAYCHSITTSANSNCFDLADHLTIQPNTDYYIRAVIQWTSTIPITIVAVLSDASMPSICGCTNPAGCDYNPDAIINSSCGYPGCMNAGACNYLTYATCDNGSCYFGSDLNGHIFHDLNGNGTWQQGAFGEPGIGIGFLTIAELGINVYPDASGSFVIPNITSGVYTVTYTDPTGAWVSSGSNPLSLTLPTCTGLVMGLVPSNLAMAQVSGLGSNWNPNIHCINGFNPGIWVYNNGNVALNGTFTLSFNQMFTATAYSNGAPFVSNSNGVVTWNINNQAPGTYAYYQVHINGPGSAYTGQSFPFTMNLVLLDNLGNEFYSNTWTTNSTVLCSYDPNDKQATPEGYADQHFILPTDEIEYRIRFQNTGNASAVDVSIHDQLDLTKLDLSTFYPVVASHSYSTIIHNDGFVEFVFHNINLPDSASNEPGSQGYVVYKIKPLAGVAPGDVIYNTADIFFDDNPAVVTNTTFHTIFSCDMLESVIDVDDVCAGETFTYTTYDTYVDEFEWHINGVLESTESIFNYTSEQASDMQILLVRSNPLCTREDVFILQNHALPGTTITASGWTLTAPQGTSWQWYLNNTLIPNVTSQTFEASSEGSYTVETTNEFDCTSISESVFLVGVNELNDFAVSLYPNPMTTFSTLQLPSGNHSVLLVNALGEIVQQWNNAKSNVRIDRDALSGGIYFLKIQNESGQQAALTLMVR